MAVRLRMKKMGRRHRPCFRIVAVDGRAARDGKVIEYLGSYDPLAKETDARAKLKTDRIDYWMSVGAQPSEKVGVLIKKYGSKGTHLEQQQAAQERLAAAKPTAPPPKAVLKPKAEEPAAEAAATEETATETADVAADEAAPAEASETAEATSESSQTPEEPQATAEESAPTAGEGESEENKE